LELQDEELLFSRSSPDYKNDNRDNYYYDYQYNNNNETNIIDKKHVSFSNNNNYCNSSSSSPIRTQNSNNSNNNSPNSGDMTRYERLYNLAESQVFNVLINILYIYIYHLFILLYIY
jgi:hypothetical protein